MSNSKLILKLPSAYGCNNAFGTKLNPFNDFIRSSKNSVKPFWIFYTSSAIALFKSASLPFKLIEKVNECALTVEGQ